VSYTLTPQLRKISVPVGKLILDPNNPRLTTRDEDLHDEVDFLDLDLSEATRSTLCADERYRVSELAKSIRQNGWLPVDSIFVRKYKGEDRYVVLEGNRRIVAIMELKKDEDFCKRRPEVAEKFENLEVMEVIDDLPDQEIKKKITYLLGVRHHGSLRKWTPFAQADNIYRRYAELAGQDLDSLIWDEGVGQEVADALSIDVKLIRERLMVYRAMRQVNACPESAGGVKDRHYSLFEGALCTRRNSELRKFIAQDQRSFLVSQEGIARLINLCQFQVDDRKGAPVDDPHEWRSLENILKEKNEDRRKQMLQEVERDHRTPSDVWAERARELTKLTWEGWLAEVNAILGGYGLGGKYDRDQARDAVRRLIGVIDSLDSMDERLEKGNSRVDKRNS
jgi:hypothetical protein